MASNFRHDPFAGLTPVFADAPVDEEVQAAADEKMPRAARPHIGKAPAAPRQWNMETLAKPVMVGALAVAMAIAVFL
jgi:hypothetical protein